MSETTREYAITIYLQGSYSFIETKLIFGNLSVLWTLSHNKMFIFIFLFWFNRSYYERKLISFCFPKKWYNFTFYNLHDIITYWCIWWILLFIHINKIYYLLFILFSSLFTTKNFPVYWPTYEHTVCISKVAYLV